MDIPEEGWGSLHLERAEPHAGRDRTDSGENRDSRQLKQGERREVRIVPCPPDLTALLRRHLAAFGTAAGGRLFVGERNTGELPKRTILQAWKRLQVGYSSGGRALRPWVASVSGSVRRLAPAGEYGESAVVAGSNS